MKKLLFGLVMVYVLPAGRGAAQARALSLPCGCRSAWQAVR